MVNNATIRDKEDLISLLKREIESISYPENPLAAYTLTDEMADCAVCIYSRAEQEKAEFIKSFEIARGLSADRGNY